MTRIGLPTATRSRSRRTNEDEDEQANMSLAAMESGAEAARARPFSTHRRTIRQAVGDARCPHSRPAERDRSFFHQGRGMSTSSCGPNRGAVNELHLHNNRIEALIDSKLSASNRRIMAIDSAMVKLADQAAYKSPRFIDEYRGCELDPAWCERMPPSPARLAGADGTLPRQRWRSCATIMRRSGQVCRPRHPANSAGS